METEDHQDMDEGEFEISNSKNTGDDGYFDTVVGALQDIAISEQFQTMQRKFIKEHLHIFEDEGATNQQQQVFSRYQQEVETYLTQRLITHIPDFSMKRFMELLTTRQEQIDEQLLDTLNSLNNFQQFKTLMRDFQEHFEEEEKVKLLTIKTNKMPETKTVKGANNIFATGNGFSFDKSPDMLVEELKKGPAKKPAKKMKPGLNVKQNESGDLQVDMLLTVKGLRKG